MERFIDISGKIENRLWGYYSLPGLEGIVPGVEIAPIASVREDGFFASKITVSSISGTYLESGSHILEKGKNLDEYSLDDFIKPVRYIRLPVQDRKSLVRASLLIEHAGTMKKGEALIVDTGWWREWNKPGYVLECPNFASDALDWVIEQCPSIFGVDVPCIESSWSEDAEESKGGLLGELFAGGSLLVAPLVNLGGILKERGRLFCLPLPVTGTSGAPARVLYCEEE